MPKTKRILAEVDANTTCRSKRSKFTATSTNKIEPKMKVSQMEPTPIDASVSERESPIIRTEAHSTVLGVHERKDYSTKDTAKLRTFLIDRDLPSKGSREDLIRLLESSTIDYETISSAELSDMLKRRHLVQPYGNKESKIARLRSNDELARDASQGPAFGALGAVFGVLHHILLDTIKKRDSIEMVDSSEKAALGYQIDNLRAKMSAKERELCQLAGHEIDPSLIFHDYSVAQAKDGELQRAAKAKQPVKAVCDYNWRESHWADRTEQQLREIARNRGVPGASTKAGIIKYLETGVLKYQDLTVSSLETMCTARALHRHGKTKLKLVETLIAADVEAGVSNDGEVSQASIDSQKVTLRM